jgi:hypothetical protein
MGNTAREQRSKSNIAFELVYHNGSQERAIQIAFPARHAAGVFNSSKTTPDCARTLRKCLLIPRK